MVALVLGCLFGARSLTPLRRVQLAPMYVLLMIFVVFFETFGAERFNIATGFDRMQQLTTRHESSDAGPVAMMARLTSFNQVSRIVRFTAEDGFERGQTLTYLGYVFVPRFLWPGKPIIALGQWFAERLELPGQRTETGVTNSINMTIAGEWYLNFGWPGTVLGGILAGLWMGLLWNAARFWSSESDLLGGTYAFYMLSLVWGMNIDLELLPTALAAYMLFWALSCAVRFFRDVRPGATSSRRTAANRPEVRVFDARAARR
jgi:hypothetical protein